MALHNKTVKVPLTPSDKAAYPGDKSFEEIYEDCEKDYVEMTVVYDDQTQEFVMSLDSNDNYFN